MWRRSRADPVRRLRERLDGFGATMDARRVLDADAIRDAEAVIDLVTRTPPRPPMPDHVAEGVFLLACLFWYRYQVLPPGQDADELAHAVRFTEVLVRFAPERVPPSLLALLRAHGPPSGPATAAPAGGRIPTPCSGPGGSGGPTGRGGGEPAELYQEAVALMGAAEWSGDYRAADRAEGLLKRALAGTPTGTPERLRYLTALGRVHRDQFRYLGRRRCLPAAIDAHRESLESTPAADPERPARLFHLGNVLGDRYELAGDAEALDESIRLLDEAVRTAPAGSPLVTTARANLGQRLRERWRRRRDPADLDRAADVLALAVRAGVDPRIGAVHGAVAAERFLLSGGDDDLTAAIEANRSVLTAGNLPDELAGVSGVSLASLLVERHQRHRDPADLDAAIEAYRAVEQTGLAGALTDGVRHTVGTLLASRYALHRRATDLAEAVRLLREGVSAAGDPVTRALRLGDLGYTLGEWAAALDGTRTTREARDLLTEAERLLPAEHPQRPGLLNNLGRLLYELADRAGEPDLLEQAVATHRAAVAGVPADAPVLPRHLANLGLALQALFARTQDLAILTEAVDVLRRAVDASPPGHPDRLAALVNHASVLNRRVELAVNGALPGAGPSGPDAASVTAAAERDARTAVRMLREAAELARREDPEAYGPVAVVLTIAYVLQHLLTGDTGPLDEAVDAARSAESLPLPAGERHRLLINLGGALLLRFRATRTTRDATDLLAAHRSAVAALPAGHPDRTMGLINLAYAIETVAGPPDDDPTGPAALPGPDPAEATAALREAAGVEAAPSLLRATAAAAYASRAADLPEALDGYATAIELLDLAAWHGMDPDDQGRLLGRFPGLASDAAAVAIALDLPRRAVELLEHGRGVLLTRAHDAGADLAVLRERAPRLADRLAELQAGLDGFDPAPASGAPGMPPVSAAPGALPVGGLSAPGAGGTPVSPSSVGGTSPGAAVGGASTARAAGGVSAGPERRHELATRRRELLAEIRRLPGFATFLLPPSFAELSDAAVGGPVVLVNVSGRRCDGLVVTPGRVRAVPLPELTHAELAVRAATCLAALAELSAPISGGDAGPVETERRRLAARRRVAETLDWLWRVVAAPVLDALDPSDAPPGTTHPPRLWWCPTGLLTLLPLHAAAPLGGGDGVLDRVIPSYTASLRALRHARRGVPAAPAPVTSALVVGMPRTPGLADLPGAAREEEIVRRHVAHVTSLTGAAATPAAVLAALPERPVAHLSCHGHQHLAAPARGRLVLAGGPLHVRDLWRPAGTSAALAVLSACDTVRGGAALPDEALTLGTAFQLAGFRHVVGALWSISDALTVRLCEDLYAGLAVPGGIDPERAATALHRAVRDLRAALPGLPDLWAGYVHIGP
ncbi:CHAT domain-containing protein [Micromonospora krabiensis]|uniref:CHAT domain-containing protein n=1 Tax=Micromonospora krabiensis TaxID=307121 RepID=A0A1C3NDJ6_9ACTN|nr:CHAT domain-containing protein [Micromonospora krabiensis]SBV30608.1 CHAT domain-containing protein [Micromonospora krabiensis]